MPIDAMNQLQNLPGGPPQVYGKVPKGNLFTGTPAYTQQFARYNPQQLGAQQNLLFQGLQNSNPDILQKRAEENFHKRTVPTLAERFTSMGAGAQNSSAFQNALGEAGVGLEGELAGLRSNIGLQQLMHGLTQGYDTVGTEAQGGLLGGLGRSLGSPQGISSLLQFLGGGASGGGISTFLPLLLSMFGKGDANGSGAPAGPTNKGQVGL